MAGLVIAAALEPAEKSLLASLPDPMRPDLRALAFVIVLILVLFFYLRSVFFNPITALMDQREKDMNAGNDAKAVAAVAIEARQTDYASKLKDLRAQAFAHKKALAEAAGQEKQILLAEARDKVKRQRRVALTTLAAQQAQAKAELTARVDALSDSVVQHLMKQV